MVVLYTVGTFLLHVKFSTDLTDKFRWGVLLTGEKVHVSRVYIISRELSVTVKKVSHPSIFVCFKAGSSAPANRTPLSFPSKSTKKICWTTTTRGVIIVVSTWCGYTSVNNKIFGIIPIMDEIKMSSEQLFMIRKNDSTFISIFAMIYIGRGFNGWRVIFLTFGQTNAQIGSQFFFHPGFFSG